MNEIDEVTRQLAQVVKDYELVKLATWERKYKELLDQMNLAHELMCVLEDYELVKSGNLSLETWLWKREQMLARADEAGVEVVPF